MLRRSDSWILAGLCVAWAVVFVRMGWSTRIPEIAPSTDAAWHAMSDAERAALVRIYQEVARRADGRRVLLDAQRYAAMSASERASLCATYQRMQTALRGPASSERWLEHLAPAARATAIFHIMKGQGVAVDVAGGGAGPAAPFSPN